jgi:PAS domain S-box-containing protein
MATALAHDVIQKGLLGEAIDTAPVAVFVADPEQKYIAVNDYACSLLGYTREELLGLRVTDVAVDERAAQEYEAMMYGAATGRTTLRAKDGREVPCAWRAGATQAGKLDLYVGICWPLEEGAS